MRTWKRLASGLLAAAMLTGLLVLAPATAAGGSSFTDISDPVMADAAEVLRLLDVVSGTGSGAFNPGGTLTRAEFCKMTIEIMGCGDQEPAQRGRTLYTDVSSTHWARGYVNLASTITLNGESTEEKGGTRLIMGVGDGTFQPDRSITYGEAVAILMRVLGYGNGDVASGYRWYDGYVALAQTSGLAEGLNLAGDSTLTRGQAVLLFYNLLFTKSKGSDAIYLTQLKGEVKQDLIILSTDAKAADGTSGSVLTSDGTFKTDHAPFSASLNGTRADLVLDGEGKLLAILPDEASTFRSVTIMGTPEANGFTVVGGETVTVRLTTPVYQNDGTKTTYEEIWAKQLRTGTSLVLCYSGSGKLDYIYQRTGTAEIDDENVMVAKNAPNGKVNPFYKLTQGSGDYQIFKNGIPADLTDLRQYDVATWDEASRTLFVSDLRLSGYYESAYPNSAAPARISVMGEEFEVLPSAIQDLSTFKVGDRMTLLLTVSGQVAGAVSTDVAKSNIVGIAKMDGQKATVTLLDGTIEVSGTTNYSEMSAAKYNGRLVTVSSYKRGQLTLTQLQGRGASDPLDLVENTLGKKELSPGLRFFEQVGNGDLSEIERSDIALATIPANKITYVGYDWAGRVDKVVLDDVTGDSYQYGMIYYQPAGLYEVEGTGSDDGADSNSDKVHTEYRNGVISVKNGGGETKCVVGTVEGAQSGRMGGIARSLDRISTGSVGSGSLTPGDYRLAGYMPLKSMTGLHRTQFDLDSMTMTTNELVLPISKNVQIYYEEQGEWYTDKAGSTDQLEKALTYTGTLTVYYDRTPEEGGKVRILVVE